MYDNNFGHICNFNFCSLFFFEQRSFVPIMHMPILPKINVKIPTLSRERKKKKKEDNLKELQLRIVQHVVFNSAIEQKKHE